MVIAITVHVDQLLLLPFNFDQGCQGRARVGIHLSGTGRGEVGPTKPVPERRSPGTVGCGEVVIRKYVHPGTTVPVAAAWRESYIIPTPWSPSLRRQCPRMYEKLA